MTEELVGLPPRESAALLDVCFAHAERPEHVYRHVWREGDLVCGTTAARSMRAPIFRRMNAGFCAA